MVSRGGPIGWRLGRRREMSGAWCTVQGLGLMALGVRGKVGRLFVGITVDVFMVLCS